VPNVQLLNFNALQSSSFTAIISACIPLHAVTQPFSYHNGTADLYRYAHNF